MPKSLEIFVEARMPESLEIFGSFFFLFLIDCNSFYILDWTAWSVDLLVSPF